MSRETLRFGVALVFLVGALFAIVAPTAALWLEVEACVDSGGRWVEHARTCERRSTPQR